MLDRIGWHSRESILHLNVQLLTSVLLVRHATSIRPIKQMFEDILTAGAWTVGEGW